VKKKRTEITVEIEEVIRAFGNSSRTSSAWCPSCGREVTMVTPQQAAAIVKVSVRTINRWVEAGAVHFVETPDGLLLLCVNSISRGILS